MKKLLFLLLCMMLSLTTSITVSAEETVPTITGTATYNPTTQTATITVGFSGFADTKSFQVALEIDEDIFEIPQNSDIIPTQAFAKTPSVKYGNVSDSVKFAYVSQDEDEYITISESNMYTIELEVKDETKLPVELNLTGAKSVSADGVHYSSSNGTIALINPVVQGGTAQQNLLNTNIINNIQTNMNTNSLMNVTNTSQNLLSDSAELELYSQIKLNNVNVGENGLRIIDKGNMDCIFSAKNNTSQNNTVTIILSTYSSDGTLYCVKTFDKEIQSGATENIDIEYEFDTDFEDSATILFWNSLSGMKPLRAKIDFSQESGINAYYYNADNRLLQIDKSNGTSLLFTYDNMGNLLTKTIRE